MNSNHTPRITAQPFNLAAVLAAPMLSGLLLLAGPAPALAQAKPKVEPKAERARAAPLGIEIGSSTCQAVAERFGVAVGRDPAHASLARVPLPSPAAHYPGAESIQAWCSAPTAPVVLLTLSVDKGGLGNPASREAYANLQAKYRRVAGGPPPGVGDGYARFEGGDTVIELRAPHLSFSFELSYFTRAVYQQAQTNQQAAQQREAQARRDGL